MKTTLQLEWTDYLAALRLNLQPRLWGWLWLISFYGLLALALVIGIIQLAGGRSTYLTYLWPLLIVAAMPPLAYYVLLPATARQIFQQMKELHGPIEFEVTPEGLRQTTALSQNLRPWSYFVKWKEDRHVLALYIANNALVFLPKRAFADAAILEAIRNYLKAAPPQPKSPQVLLRAYLIAALIVLAVIVFLLQVLASYR